MVDRLGHDLGCLLTAMMWMIGVLAVIVVTLAALILAGVI